MAAEVDVVKWPPEPGRGRIARSGLETECDAPQQREISVRKFCAEGVKEPDSAGYDGVGNVHKVRQA